MHHQRTAEAFGKLGTQHARHAVDRAARGPGHDEADGPARSLAQDSQGNEKQRDSRERDRFHFLSFSVSSFAMREASLSFSMPSTVSRNCATWPRLSAWAASLSNFPTICASLAKFGSLPRGVSTARSRRLPSSRITSTRTLWRYFAPFALISGSARTLVFSARATRLGSATKAAPY